MNTTEQTARHIECSLEEYHARPEWSHSQIETLLESPALFEGRHITKVFPRKSSKEFDVGTIAHQCLSTPGGMNDILAIIPETVLNDDGHRKGKDWLNWAKANTGKIQMKRAELEPVIRMVESVQQTAPAWLLNGDHEYGIVYRDDELGLNLRARPDLICDHRGDILLVDYKTTRTTTPRTFARDAGEYGYHRQAAWYCDAAVAMGMTVAAFVFIAVDKTPAHETYLYEMDWDDIALGREQNRAALADLAQRLLTNNWKGPSHGEILSLSLPDWARREDRWSL